ncbi:LysR family transcriptional regulator [Hydrogenophaga sp. ANAO-22]|jgi:DNA-binding transcriptional LysR family regulator|uniref:LysR family transcriptional regulator n=1 Tax=Hydrogenophaga sp. ANAO-22 TaxID=3166645 RepID=UPI0036D3DE46
MAIMNYRVDDLRALTALHRTGSFVRAAESVHITQSAFSRRIAQLEAVVGGTLVERTTRRVSLSPLGLDLVRKTGLLLDQLDDAVAEAGRCARGESGRIDVACLTTVAYAVLPPVLDAFRRRYPQVRLHLRDDTGQRVTQAVLSREAEFGIGVLGHPTAELLAEHCADDPYVIAFRAGHPLQRRRRVAWKDLQSWRVVALRSTSANRQQIDEALAAAGIASPWFDEVEHLSSMLGLLRGGVGIGVLPRLALHSGAAVDLLTRPLHSPDVARRIGLIRRRDATLSRPAEALWGMLREQLARYA